MFVRRIQGRSQVWTVTCGYTALMVERERELTNGEREPKLDKNAAKPADFSMNEGGEDILDGSSSKDIPVNESWIPEPVEDEGSSNEAEDTSPQKDDTATPKEKIPPRARRRAVWKTGGTEISIVVTGSFGETEDGREYLTIEGNNALIPADEVEFLGDSEDAGAEEGGAGNGGGSGKDTAAGADSEGEEDDETGEDLGSVEEYTQGMTPEECAAFMKQYADGKKIKKLTTDEIDKIVEKIKNVQTNDEMERELDRLQRYVRLTKKIADDKTYESYIKELEEIKGEIDIIKQREKATSFAEKIVKHYKSYEGSDVREEKVRSLEHLAELIMDSEEDKWRTNGSLELINKEGEFIPAHFLAWIRSRILFYDSFSPDAEINLFSEISIPTIYRSITFSEIVGTSRYFMKREKTVEGVYVKEDRVLRADSYKYGKDEEYNHLKDECLNEVWLFGKNHNNDVNYRLIMGQAKAVNETLAKVNYGNEFTMNRKRLLWILKLPGVEGEDVKKLMESPDLGEINQGMVGKIVRRALLAYSFLPDEEMFNKVLGDEGIKAFYDSVIKQSFSREIKALEKIKEEKFMLENPGKKPTAEDIRVDIFGADKKNFLDYVNQGDPNDPSYFKRPLNISEEYLDNLIANRREFALRSLSHKYFNTKKEFIDFKEWDNNVKNKEMPFSRLNIYSQNKKEQTLIDLTRKAIRDGISAAEHLSEKQEIDRDYGETWAFKFTYWTGISAYNDTDAIGFDKWSNILNTKEYRIRQASGGRGVYGMDDTVYGIERLGLNLWQALKVKKEGGRGFDTPLIKLLQGSSDPNEINLSSLEDFDFQGNAQRQFTVEHVSNAFQLLDFLINKHGMNFSQFLKKDYSGRLIIDKDKAEEIVKKGVWHDLRYAYDMPAFLWDDKTRGWWREEGRDKDGKRVRRLRFGDKTTKEFMFNKEIREMGMYERADTKAIMEQKEENTYVARDIFAYLIGKELYYHRKWRVGQERWSSYEIRMIKEFFGEWGLEIQEVVKNGFRDVEIKAPFFTNEEWEKHIAPLGKVTYKRLLAEELSYSGGVGVASFAVGTTKAFFKYIFSSS